jgi:hypothetical protein
MIVTGSIGLLAPAGTPIGIVEQIAQASRHSCRRTDLKQMLIDAGNRTHSRFKLDKFRQSLADDVVLWTPVVNALGLKID